jgi:hypothetical protein
VSRPATTCVIVIASSRTWSRIWGTRPSYTSVL